MKKRKLEKRIKTLEFRTDILQREIIVLMQGQAIVVSRDTAELPSSYEMPPYERWQRVVGGG
jgi:hypothetical protein